MLKLPSANFTLTLLITMSSATVMFSNSAHTRVLGHLSFITNLFVCVTILAIILQARYMNAITSQNNLTNIGLLKLNLMNMPNFFFRVW